MASKLDLTSVKAKLEWARGHFEVVDREITAWLESNPHVVVFQCNHQCTKFWLTLRVNGAKPDFERWSLMVGDCVTNLRDTLDHLIYAIAHLSNSPNPTKSDRAAFIIRKLEVNFDTDAKTRLCSVPDVVENAVRRYQPFNRSHSLLPPLLGILAELANGNKHKMLSLMMTTPASLDINLIDEAPERQGGVTFEIFHSDLEDGSPIAIWQFPRPAPNLKFNRESKIALHVAIRHEALEGNTAFDADRTSYSILLRHLFAEVELVIEDIAKLI
jgi:hypothetical protein